MINNIPWALLREPESLIDRLDQIDQITIMQDRSVDALGRSFFSLSSQREFNLLKKQGKMNSRSASISEKSLDSEQVQYLKNHLMKYFRLTRNLQSLKSLSITSAFGIEAFKCGFENLEFIRFHRCSNVTDKNLKNLKNLKN